MLELRRSVVGHPYGDADLDGLPDVGRQVPRGRVWGQGGGLPGDGSPMTVVADRPSTVHRKRRPRGVLCGLSRARLPGGALIAVPGDPRRGPEDRSRRSRGAVVGPLGPNTFVGRSVELSTLRSVLERVRAGHPQTLLIHGRAGMGKTTLVEELLREEEGISLLRGSGEQWEALVPYGVVEQLMRSAGTSTTRLFSSRCERCRPRNRSVSGPPCWS